MESKILAEDKSEDGLVQLIHNLMDEQQKGVSDLSSFASNFRELMQAKAEPSLESIWVFTALNFHGKISGNGDIFYRIASVKELFQLVSVCSVSCNGLKSVCLLAPVVYELHRLVKEMFLNKELSSKKEKKAVREIVIFIDAVLGYISLCCCNGDGMVGGSISLFGDLVSIWMNASGEGKENLELFLPLVGNEVRMEVSEGGCEMRCLAGAVTTEALLLKLCLKFLCGVPRLEMENELKNSAIASITGLQIYAFFEILLKMLLDPTLPVASLLQKSDDNVLLRNVLCDVVILVDYSFLTVERLNEQPAECINSIAVMRLIVMCQAIQFSRHNGDQKRAFSYTNFFSLSRLSSQLVNWVRSQRFMEGKDSRLSSSSPEALLRWLLSFENQGLRIFGDSILKYCSRIGLDTTEADQLQPEVKVEGKSSDNKPLFFIDNKGSRNDEGEDQEAPKMGRKRKERGSEKGTQKKFRKSDHDNDSDARSEESNSSSESEIENPESSDDDTN